MERMKGGKCGYCARSRLPPFILSTGSSLKICKEKCPLQDLLSSLNAVISANERN